MTKRITISVPDDVAEHLETVGERRVSSYVAAAVRYAAQREAQQRALQDLYQLFGKPSSDDDARVERFAAQVDAWQSARVGGAHTAA